jgi:hypothetical protein
MAFARLCASRFDQPLELSAIPKQVVLNIITGARLQDGRDLPVTRDEQGFATQLFDHCGELVLHVGQCVNLHRSASIQICRVILVSNMQHRHPVRFNIGRGVSPWILVSRPNRDP